MLTRVLRLLRDSVEIGVDPVRYARRIGVTVGERCRLIGIDRHTFGSEPYLISLGDDVCVTDGVRFVTHDGSAGVFRHKYPDLEVVGRIVLHERVFVGMGAILLPGIEIGPESVIGAGSVVSRSVPAGTVAAGVPARPVRSIAEHEAAILRRAVFVRNSPPAERRRVHLEHTAGGQAGASIT
ncbi:MAG TPA: acyltransferase [Pilimelia sp.]|nr:acyltransferase [Pilimelia sp.]